MKAAPIRPVAIKIDEDELYRHDGERVTVLALRHHKEVSYLSLCL